jgi:ABC-type bacteriocin/lantibiotic exporter with double-glycine peptidase domain
MGAAYKIIPGLVKIINAGGQMKAYELSITDLVKYNNSLPGKNTSTDEHGIHSIQFKKINFQYSKQVLINNLSFSIQKGDFTGIAGDSGKGKTTALNLLLGFLTPNNGQILINDRILNAEDLKTYWPFISYVRQQPFFIHDTILRNITLEENGHNDKALQCALKVSGLMELVSTFPEGLGKIITENGKNISGGQQQRITIARALYKKADLILLDEPFNELDEASGISMLEHFRELSASGKMIILITHDKKSLSYCNQVISLDEQ